MPRRSTRNAPASTPRGRASAAGAKRSNTIAQPRSRIPEGFHDLLRQDARARSAAAAEGERPLKRRKVWAGPSNAPVRNGKSKAEAILKGYSDEEPDRKIQTVTTDPSESEESDEDWEEVGITSAGQSAIAPVEEAEEKEEQEDLAIVIGAKEQEETSPRSRRRRPLTNVEKYERLQIHKLHLLCLISHCFRRNDWCNDRKVHAVLRKVAPPKIINMLHADPNVSQVQASTSFTNGLIQLASVWDSRFKLTSYGFVRPTERTNGGASSKSQLGDDVEAPLEREDFRRATVSLEGSPDLGAQLFCALLRSIGVEARLVCSLQTLSISAPSPAPTSNTPNTGKTVVYATDSDTDTSMKSIKSTASAKDVPPSGNLDPLKTTNNASPLPLRRLGRIGTNRHAPNSPTIDQGKPPPRFNNAKRITRPTHPVFWVEALNHAHQKWIPVDPHATKSVNKASKLEPALNDPAISMTYVLAFEEDGSARDVTRRYAKAFNAKTRKLRIEGASPSDGAAWYSKALGLFKRRKRYDRDTIEDAELARKEAAEGMPRNVQDFKDHPYYALERHLRRGEVVHPKNESGRINTGTAAKPKIETVYRRRDVHVVRSADKWFRFGREVKMGEVPLKVAMPPARKRRRGESIPIDEGEGDPNGEQPGVGLYALHQTETYIPPPVVNGMVPKNAYGNIDVYVPSMVPRGGAHIRLPKAKIAARILGISFADAVTGFNFKGRHGTAVTQGVVVAAENAEAVYAVISGLESLMDEEEEDFRRREALRMWRAFLIGLRIRERVRGYRKPGEEDDEEEPEDHEDEEFENEMQEEIDAEMQRYDESADEEAGIAGAGGFFFEADEQAARPTVDRFKDAESQNHGGFIHDDNMAGGFEPENYETPAEGFVREENAGMAGGFIPDDHAQEAGGFLPDDEAQMAGGFSPDHQSREAGGFILDDNEDGGGGFLPNDGLDGGGGFMLESSSANAAGDTQGDITMDNAAENAHHLPPQETPSEIDGGPQNGTPKFQRAAGPVVISEAATAKRVPAVQAVDFAKGPVESIEQTKADPQTSIPSQKNEDSEHIAKELEVQDPSNNPNEERDAVTEVKMDVVDGPRKMSRTSSEEYAESLPSHDSAEEDADAEWVL